MIFLVGFMGSGKTTIGKMLAKKLGWECLDTDQLIEQKCDMKIKEIFEKYGEARFREMETETLMDLDADHHGVVMTGGGMAGTKINRDLMKAKGKVIWLNCGFEELAKRITNDDTRPLVTQRGLAGLKSLYEERLPLYELAADYTIKTSCLTVDETIERILACLNIDLHGETNS
jgi:shikimate kinase